MRKRQSFNKTCSNNYVLLVFFILKCRVSVWQRTISVSSSVSVVSCLIGLSGVQFGLKSGLSITNQIREFCYSFDSLNNMYFSFKLLFQLSSLQEDYKGDRNAVPKGNESS